VLEEPLTLALAEQLMEVNDLKPGRSVLDKREIKTNVVVLQGQQTDLSLVVKLMTQARGMQCHLSKRPAFGDHDWIIFVQFADGIEWVARVPLRSHQDQPQLDFADPLFKARYECMIQTIEYVGLNTTIPVPRIQKYDLTCNNILLRPYILMDCLPGKPFSSIMENLTEEQIKNIIRQWAQYTIELTDHQFPQIGTLSKDANRYVMNPLLPEGKSVDDMTSGRGPFRSVADFVLGMSTLKKRGIATAETDPRTYGRFLRSSLIESLIPFFLLPEYLNAPFVLSHPTLDIDSILVDSSGRLTGILSWQRAAVLPLQSHIRIPDSLNLEFMPPSEKADKPATLRFSQKYRPHYEKALIEAAGHKPWPIEELIDRSLMFGLFERAIIRTEDERYLPALWEHVYGNTVGAEDFRGAMKRGDWGMAMADRWGIRVHT
jgi:hypothetical protein